MEEERKNDEELGYRDDLQRELCNHTEEHKRAEAAGKVSKKKIGLFILYGAVTVFILALILSLNDIEAIFGVIKTLRPGYLMLAVLCVCIYLAIYPISLCILTRARGSDINMKKTYTIGMTEHFFNGITPFATGGQPFQVYAFARHKVKPSESTCLLLMNFLVYMIVNNLFALTSLFFFKEFVSSTGMGVVAAVGFTMNFLVLVVTILLATSKRVCNLLMRITDFLCRFKWIARFLAPKAESLKGYFIQVQDAFSHLIRKKRAFVCAIITKILAFAGYFASTFFILRALHVNVPINELFFIICGTSFAVTMVVFIPTPGASGGIEFAFKSVFVGIIAAGMTSAVSGVEAVSYGGMLIWRMLTYYLVMLISLGFYVALEIIISRAQKKEGA